MERVEMINTVTGTVMSVPADLVEMYLRAGFKLAPPPAPAAKPAAKKKTARK